jgi:hypothetical protein
MTTMAMTTLKVAMTMTSKTKSESNFRAGGRVLEVRAAASVERTKESASLSCHLFAAPSLLGLIAGSSSSGC